MVQNGSLRAPRRTGSRRSYSIAMVLVLIGMCFLAFLVGAGISLKAYLYIAPLILIVPTVFLLMRPDLCLWLLAGLILVVAGGLKYFLGLGQFQWAVSGLGLALLTYSVVRQAFSREEERSSTGGIAIVMILWWIILLFSSAANTLPFSDWLVGLRIYLPIFGVFVYIAYCKPNEAILKKVIFFMLFIAAIQWVFCLYQRIEVLPIRMASKYPGSPWDSIVGTFGGDKFGGGESGSLGIYLSIAVALGAALFKKDLMRPFFFALLLVFSVAAMAMVESKVIAIMVPLGLFIVYRDHVVKHPVRFLLGSQVVLFAMFMLLVAYYYLYWSESGNHSLIEAIQIRLAYSFDPHFQATTVSLGRVKSLIFWWEKNSLTQDPLAFLLGHGLASAVSFSSIIGEGAAVARYKTILDVTGISKLLWESGILGAGAFLMIFFVGALRARKLKSNPLIPQWHQALMTGVEASMVLMALSVFYEVTVVSSPPMQFSAMFLLGYVAYWWRVSTGVKVGSKI